MMKRRTFLKILAASTAVGLIPGIALTKTGTQRLGTMVEDISFHGDRMEYFVNYLSEQYMVVSSGISGTMKQHIADYYCGFWVKNTDPKTLRRTRNIAQKQLSLKLNMDVKLAA